MSVLHATKSLVYVALVYALVRASSVRRSFVSVRRSLASVRRSLASVRWSLASVRRSLASVSVSVSVSVLVLVSVSIWHARSVSSSISKTVPTSESFPKCSSEPESDPVSKLITTGMFTFVSFARSMLSDFLFSIDAVRFEYGKLCSSNELHSGKECGLICELDFELGCAEYLPRESREGL